MKRSTKRLALCLALVAGLAAAGCSGAKGDGPAASGGAPQDDGVRGIVVEVQEGSIVIAKLPSGDMGGNGARPTGGQRPDGTPPAGGRTPNGTPPAGGGNATVDTSTLEKVTYKIDDSTKIVERAGPSDQSAATALTLADVQTGAMVSIQPKSGDAQTAAQIALMQGMGRAPGAAATETK